MVGVMAFLEALRNLHVVNYCNLKMLILRPCCAAQAVAQAYSWRIMWTLSTWRASLDLLITAIGFPCKLNTLSVETARKVRGTPGFFKEPY